MTPDADVRPAATRVGRASAERRTLDDSLVARAPRLYRALSAAGWTVMRRMPPRSRLRRALLLRNVVRTYNAFNRQDLPVFLGMFDPDVVYDLTHVAGWPERPTYRGPTGLAEMAHDWFETWDFWFDLVEVRDLGGDRCLVMANNSLRGAGSGVPIESMPWFQVATARRGLCLRVDNFTDRAQALTAAGLPA
jgi:SnoaL-like domain